MNKLWCVLVFAGSIGISGNLVAGGHGHHSGGGGFGHHSGGGGFGHHFGGGGFGRHFGHSGRSHVGIGFYFGPNFGYPYNPYYGYGNYPYYGYPYNPYYGYGNYPYYGYPYNPYYGYPPAVINTSPPVYIERQADGPSSGNSKGYWYYCSDPSGYYPYIKECHNEWQPVLAQPPSYP
ncbi:MAG: hypothetical protein ACRESZ_20485 [Methylococcales bacterium]